MKQHKVTIELTLPEKANPKYQNLSLRETQKWGHRIIGGDLADLQFDGYTTTENTTTLINPMLLTDTEYNEDEVNNIAYDTLFNSYNNIGIETVEHN